MLKIIERYKKFKEIKSKKPYDDLVFSAVKKSNKIVRLFKIINNSFTLSFALTFSALVFFNMPKSEYTLTEILKASFVSFNLTGLISFLFIYTFNYFLFSKLFNKKLRNEYNNEIKSLFNDHKFQEYIKISDLFRNYGNFKNVDVYPDFVVQKSTKETLNLAHVKTIDFLKEELRELSDKELLENHKELILFLQNNTEFENEKNVFNIFYQRYENMLSKELINIDTFEKHLLTIMNTIFKDLELFSEIKNDLTNYVDSYKKINNIKTYNTIKKQKQTVF